MLLIGAQISHTVRQIKSEMTMHIQIRNAFMCTRVHVHIKAHRHTFRESGLSVSIAGGWLI